MVYYFGRYDFEELSFVARLKYITEIQFTSKEYFKGKKIIFYLP